MGVHPFILTPMDPSADGARTSQRRREKRVFHAVCAYDVLGTSLPPVGTHIGLASYSSSMAWCARRPLLSESRRRTKASLQRRTAPLSPPVPRWSRAPLAIAAAAAARRLATETRAPTLARTLAFRPAAAADEAAAPPPRAQQAHAGRDAGAQGGSGLRRSRRGALISSGGVRRRTRQGAPARCSPSCGGSSPSAARRRRRRTARRRPSRPSRSQP